LRLAIEGENMLTYYSFRNIYTYTSEYYFRNHYMLIGKYILVIFHRLFVSDVIKTVTFETENWSKFRDETET